VREAGSGGPAPRKGPEPRPQRQIRLRSCAPACAVRRPPAVCLRRTRATDRCSRRQQQAQRAGRAAAIWRMRHTRPPPRPASQALQRCPPACCAQRPHSAAQAQRLPAMLEGAKATRRTPHTGQVLAPARPRTRSAAVPSPPSSSAAPAAPHRCPCAGLCCSRLACCRALAAALRGGARHCHAVHARRSQHSPRTWPGADVATYDFLRDGSSPLPLVWNRSQGPRAHLGRPSGRAWRCRDTWARRSAR
jgi:hypothetical protein